VGQIPPTQDPLPTSRSGQAWPDGWYVYEDGSLNGPLTAAETFNRAPVLASGKPLLVSRKGFSQWYPLRDLSEIYLASIGSVQQAPQVQPKVMAKKVGSQAVPTLVHGAKSPQVIAKSPQVIAKSPQVTFKRPQVTFKRPLTAPQHPMSVPSESVLKTSTRATSAAAASHAKKAVLQEYFLARTRLRLGQIRSPWMSGLAGVTLSIGIYWPIWFASVQKEMLFHTHSMADSKKVNIWHALLAVVPILHLYLTYRLAKQVRAMEAQNKYQYTSPALATALAIIPPLAVVYLQQALNRHWLLHAKHVVVKRRAQAA